MAATKDQFFKQTKQSGHDKAAQTHSVSQSIVAAEAAAREKKTERLRALRLAQPPKPTNQPGSKKRV